MALAIQDDRLLKISRDANDDQDWEVASARLDRAAITISADPNLSDPAMQAAAVALVACGSRMFRGGVYLHASLEAVGVLGPRPFKSLRHELRTLGGRIAPPPEHALRVHIGTDTPADGATIWCWTDGWIAATGPSPEAADRRTGNVISGALAGSMAASEAFRSLIFSDPRAGKRTQQLSPYRPEQAISEDASLSRLPAALWFVGMGNLGQANLKLTSLLPYSDPSAVRLVIQDMDRAGKENIDIQVLTTDAWVGKMKSRMAADWADDLGFDTRVTELPFTTNTVRTGSEPQIVIAGVDNLPTRRAVARPDAKFGLVIDAGLGATAAESFDIRVHAFPGAKNPGQAWPDVKQEEQKLPPAYEKLVTSGKLDRCGAVTLFGKSIGVPSTAMAAAAIQMAQVCRVLTEGTYADYIDVTTTNTKNAETSIAKHDNAAALQFVEAWK